jgi:hypothetical protein
MTPNRIPQSRVQHGHDSQRHSDCDHDGRGGGGRASEPGGWNGATRGRQSGPAAPGRSEHGGVVHCQVHWVPGALGAGRLGGIAASRLPGGRCLADGVPPGPAARRPRTGSGGRSLGTMSLNGTVPLAD